MSERDGSLKTATEPADGEAAGRQRTLAEMAVDERHGELARAVFAEKYAQEYGAEPWEDYDDLSPADSEAST